MLKIDKEDLLKIDDAFSQLIENRRNTLSLSSLVLVLNKSFGKTFTIKISNSSVDSSFNLMTVTPSENVLNDVIVGVMNGISDKEIADKWNSNNKWEILIDNRLLEGILFPVTNRELTAILLHECGHVIDSNVIPYRICRAMKFQSSKLGIGMRVISSNGMFVKILHLPIIKACSLKKDSDMSLQKEMRADLYAVKCGYGNELNSVFKKIIDYNDNYPKNLGSSIGDEKLKEMEEDMIFSLDTINAIKQRNSRLAFENFKRMALMIPMELAFGLGNAKKVIFNSFTREAVINDSFINAVDGIYESAYIKESFDIFKKKMKRIDPSIVDYITIRKDGIKSNDEKLMLVQYIYSKLDLIDYYLDIMNNPKYEKRYVFLNSKAELIRMKEQLEQARVSILNYKIPITQYGVQINYPDGYYG